YLDAVGEVNNTTPGGPFIAAQPGEFNNDRLATVVAADLMPLVERRIALEVRNALLAYRSVAACRCYPWADSGNDGRSDLGAHQGRVPAAQALPDAWRPGLLPRYVLDEGWWRVIHYAVARDALEEGGAR